MRSVINISNPTQKYSLLCKLFSRCALQALLIIIGAIYDFFECVGPLGDKDIGHGH